MPQNPILSLIVPTRHRTGQLRRLLHSLAATAANPAAVEVVLVVDADDRESIEFDFAGLALKRVVVEPGLAMGALNMEGYQASAGTYLMLLNDDVVARTRGWDRKIKGCFRGFPDDIVLVHTNDTLFKEGLCTFPVVSRTFCRLVGGICPRTYVRYRIDDHIEDIFNLLGLLDERRTVYLPDVVFEHLKFMEQPQGKTYFLDENILAVDAPHFESLLAERKELALKLKLHIQGRQRQAVQQEWRSRLAKVHDSFPLRVAGRLRLESDSRPLVSAETRVTIGVVAADCQARQFRRCLDAIKAHTSNYELMVLDHEMTADFNHPRTLNRLLHGATTDYVVLMQDGVRVGPGWLDSLLGCARGNVGVVCPSSEVTDPAGWAQRALIVSGSLVVIDAARCRHLFFNENYRSDFFYTDFSLAVWEAGLEIVCAPAAISYHPTNTPPPGPEQFEADRQHFEARWLETGRLRRLQERWIDDPQLSHLLGANISDFFSNRSPGYRSAPLAQIRSSLSAGLKRLRRCVHRGGYAGLVRAVGRRVGRHFGLS